MNAFAGRFSRPSALASVTLAVVLSGSTALAQREGSPRQVAITLATADATYIYVTGVNFGSDPSVFLGGLQLDGVTVNADGTQITVLNPGFLPGTYLLHVSTGKGAVQNGTFDFTLGAAGPAGPPGADGQDGEDGAPGAPGPPGPALTSLNALNGLPCTVGTEAGTVLVTTATDGTISFRCDVSSPPPDTGLDFLPFSSKEAYFTAFRLFEFPSQLSAATPEICIGDPDGALGTGGCAAASPTGVSLTTDAISISEPGGTTALGALGHFSVRWQFDVSLGPVPLTFQVFGVGGSCTLTGEAPNAALDLVFEFDRTDTARDVITLQTANLSSFSASLAGCGVLTGVGNLLFDFLAAMRDQAVQAFIGALPPVCRARDSMTFEACPTP